MSVPTFQTSLFSNLVMLTRNDDRLTMTGCLCRDVTARHFELNTPITIKMDELKDSLPDFWAPWPTLNYDKVRDMYGADRDVPGLCPRCVQLRNFCWYKKKRRESQ